jgi:hypothetical protein
VLKRYSSSTLRGLAMSVGQLRFDVSCCAGETIVLEVIVHELRMAKGSSV